MVTVSQVNAFEVKNRGQLIELQVTKPDGDKSTIGFTHEALGQVINTLLSARMHATRERDAAGILDFDKLTADFNVLHASVIDNGDEIGLALALGSDSVFPFTLHRVGALALATRLAAVADGGRDDTLDGCLLVEQIH